MTRRVNDDPGMPPVPPPLPPQARLPAQAPVPLPYAGVPPAGLPRVQPAPQRFGLDWWAWLALVPFGAVELLVTWPRAVARGGPPGTHVSYFAGHAVGGLFFALLLAWVVWRAGGRKQVAASVTFIVVMLMATFGSMNPARPRPGTGAGLNAALAAAVGRVEPSWQAMGRAAEARAAAELVSFGSFTKAEDIDPVIADAEADLRTLDAFEAAYDASEAQLRKDLE